MQSLFFFVIDATIYVGGLDDKVSVSILWELFLQAGPVGNIILIKLKLTDSCNIVF